MAAAAGSLSGRQQRVRGGRRNPDVGTIGADPRQAVNAARAASADADRLDRSVYVLAGTEEQVVEHLEAIRIHEGTGVLRCVTRVTYRRRAPSGSPVTTPGAHVAGSSAWIVNVRLRGSSPTTYTRNMAAYQPGAIPWKYTRGAWRSSARRSPALSSCLGSVPR